MNNLTNNPAFLKRMENAVEFPTEETSVDFLKVGLCVLAFVGSVAILYKVFEPQKIVINHNYPPKQSGGAVPEVTESKISTQAQN